MHEYSKHAAEKTEKEDLKEEKKHQKELEKEEKKHQKELEKEEKKEEKKHQKEIEKEEKKQQKELEKEQKKHEKEIEKEEKKHEKEVEKEEKKKHGGGLLGFLHRDKDKDEEKTTEPATTSDKHHRKEEAAGAAAVAGAGAAAYEHEHDKSGRNKLHKDPPSEYVRAHGGEHYGTDGRIGEAGAVSGLEQSGHGQYGAANSGDQGGIVIEPHTGLPMNVGKYGTGAGGTDGNETITGMHSHGAGTDASGANVASQGNVQGSNTGTDWEGIKKANTPY
ncbi:hypothetical protein GTA08_BOTSDO08174 [Neofusicoccum parvum]|nr:hypothetical protein GTA08_BOTSDO08174 [Neofusicoccum parvum]